MAKVILICILVAAVIVGGALLLNHFGIWPFGSGIGDGEGDGTVDSPITDPDVETDLPDIQDIVVVERPQSLVIEISEEKIMYDGEEISLDDLEAVMQQFENLEDIWTLEDSYRAEKAIYDSVKDLLVKYDMAFKER